MQRYGLLLVVYGIFFAATLVSVPLPSVPAPEPTPPPAPTTMPAPTPNTTLPDYGTTTNSSGEIKNGAARQHFMEAYRARTPGRWQQIGYSVEGDPIIYRLEYEGHGTTIRLIHDSTQDQFSSRQAVGYKCQQLIEDGDQLHLVGCNDGTQQHDMIIDMYELYKEVTATYSLYA